MTKISYLEELAGTLKEVIQKNLTKTGKITFSEEPKIIKKDIIEYDHRMRVSGLEKFNAPAYVAGISYYRSPKDQEEHNACGAIVLYVEEQYVEILLKALGQTGIDDENEEMLSKKCGEFCSIVGEEFTTAVSGQGYNDLVAAVPISFRNTIQDGIDFSYTQYEKYEISFLIKAKKIMVAEITITPRK